MDSLKVDKVIIADSSPVIDRIINTFNQNEERSLLKGKELKSPVIAVSKTVTVEA